MNPLRWDSDRATAEESRFSITSRTATGRSRHCGRIAVAALGTRDGYGMEAMLGESLRVAERISHAARLAN